MTLPTPNRTHVESLLAETSWLRRLCLELVPPSEREDLVQDVLLRAIQLPESPQSPRAWLATVARNLAFRMRLRGHRRLARERAVGSTEASVPSAADTAQRFATHQTLVDAVDGLDEPLRTAVLLRFFEGLPPREVARRTGVPVETARTRIKRALDRLRLRLDEDAGSRHAWALPLLSLHGVPTAATAHAASASLLALLTMKTAVVGVASLLLAVLWLASSTTPEARAVVSATPASPEVGAARDAGSAATTAPEAEAATTRNAVDLPRHGVLAASVRRADGAPAVGIGVELWSADSPQQRAFARTEPTGVAFDGLLPGNYVVHLDRGPRREVRVEPGERTECSFELAAGVLVRGSVALLDGQPVADATVVAIAVDHPGLCVGLGTTGLDGTFALHDVPAGTVLMARKPGWQPSAGRGFEVRGTPGSERQVRLVLGAEAHTLTGTVLTPDGRPAPFARVLVGVDEDCRKHLGGLERPRDSDGRGGLDREAIVVTADEAGRFSTREVPFGDTVVVARGSGLLENAIGLAAVLVQRSRQNSVEVHLKPGAVVTGTVRDETGTAYGGVRLRFGYDDAPEVGEFDRDVLAREVLDRTTDVGRDGSFRVEGLLAAEYQIARETATRTDRVQRVDVPPEGANVELVLPRLRGLRVALTDPDGKPQPGFAVVASRDATIPMRRSPPVTDGNGIADLTSVPPDAEWLTIHAPRTDDGADEPFHRMPSHAHRLEAGSREFTVVVSRPDARFSARVVDAEGSPCGGASIECTMPPSQERIRLQAGDDGRVARADLPAGDYRLRARSGDVEVEVPFLIGVGEHKDLGDLWLPRGARLEVEVVVDGRTRLDVDVRLFRGETPERTDGHWSLVDALQIADGGLRSALLKPGTYWLQVHAKDCAPAGQPVELAIGQRQLVRVAPEAGRELRILVGVSDAKERSQGHGFATATVLDGNGRPLLARTVEQTFADRTQPVVEIDVRLSPGTYTVRASGRTGRGETTVTVGDANAPLRIDLQ